MARVKAQGRLRELLSLLPPLHIESRLHKLPNGQVIEEVIVDADDGAWADDPRSGEVGWIETHPVPGRTLASRLRL